MRRSRLARRLSALTAVAGTVILCSSSVASASGGWTVQPVPPTRHTAFVDSVSCRSTTACVTVGQGFPSGRHAYALLAYVWNGTSWTRQPVPPPASSSVRELTAVSCFSAVQCTAVGYYQPSPGTGFLPLAEHLAGGSWQLETVPPPPSATETALDGVSCPAPNWCMAVGVDYSTSAAAEVWNGTSWASVPTPPVGNSSTTLNKVSCTSASSCIAVGQSNDADGTEAAVAESWNGTSWTLQQLPTLAGNDNFLGGVSCSSATACTAVGEYIPTPTGNAKPLAVRWNGTAWATQSFPAGTSLVAVSCPAAASCTAAGTAGIDDAGPPQIFHWNGSGWHIVTTPVPAGSLGASLYGISCLRSGYCAAVGGYFANGQHPLAEDN